MAAAAIVDFQEATCIYSSVMAVRCLSSVPNLVQISLTLSEIDAILFSTLV